MITNFKIFESNNVLEKYINNIIFIKYNGDYKDYDIDTKYIIYICSNAITSNNNLNEFYLEFDCFDIDEKYNILDIYVSSDTLNDEKIYNIPFLKPIDFYNTYTDACTNFYNSLRDNYEKNKESTVIWKIKMLKNCKYLLETLPAFKHYSDAEKYNL